MDSSWPLFVQGSAESEAATEQARSVSKQGETLNCPSSRFGFPFDRQVLERLVPDPKVRETLTPTYPLG